MVIGNVRTTKMGLIILFKNERTTAKIMASTIPSTLIPGIKKSEMSTAMAEMRILTRKFIEEYFCFESS